MGRGQDPTLFGARAGGGEAAGTGPHSHALITRVSLCNKHRSLLMRGLRAAHRPPAQGLARRTARGPGHLPLSVASSSHTSCLSLSPPPQSSR